MDVTLNRLHIGFLRSSMMSGGNLQAIFGDKIAGVPTETVLAITQAQVWGGGVIL